jgi:hypothetical protein
MKLSKRDAERLTLNPTVVLERLGLDPDPWQREFLLADDRQVLLNCSRQAGKSSCVAALAVHTALFRPGSLVLLLSPTQRQSHELFRKVLDGYRALDRPVATVQDAVTMSKLELTNGSRIIGLPGKEGSIRSFSKVRLLLIDEAARVPDDLYKAVRPMLAVSHGRLVALSTPFGQRGWFYDEWEHGGGWKRFSIPWEQCPRITADFIEREERSMGRQWVDQEFRTLFTALSGLVYGDFGGAVVDEVGPVTGRLVGGIDFGHRNPFAALWGVLDRDDVLHLVGERYLKETALSDHAEALLRAGGGRIMWYADPAGATEIAELRRAGLVVRRGDNSIRAGIQAVTARIVSGRLRVSRTGCPNLIAESKLYHYPTAAERALVGENPIDSDNHCASAARYLIAGIDHAYMAKLRGRKVAGDGVTEAEAEEIGTMPVRPEEAISELVRPRRAADGPVETAAQRHRRLMDTPECWS